jgi:hypothetical protein
MRISNKIFLTIAIILILLGSIYGGSRYFRGTLTEAAMADQKLTDADLSSLMTAMNIQKSEKPVLPPDFTLISIAEEQINLRQQRGKVVMLSFWATW